MTFTKLLSCFEFRNLHAVVYLSSAAAGPRIIKSLPFTVAQKRISPCMWCSDFKRCYSFRISCLSCCFVLSLSLREHMTSTKPWLYLNLRNWLVFQLSSSATSGPWMKRSLPSIIVWKRRHSCKWWEGKALTFLCFSNYRKGVHPVLSVAIVTSFFQKVRRRLE